MHQHGRLGRPALIDEDAPQRHDPVLAGAGDRRPGNRENDVPDDADHARGNRFEAQFVDEAGQLLLGAGRGVRHVDKSVRMVEHSHK